MSTVRELALRHLTPAATPESGPWRAPEWRRILQLILASIWLLDGVLQLQPFFFAPGHNGFSGMLAGTAPGNPGWITHSITWDASVVGHHAQLTNAAFAFFQILLGLGIAWRRTLKVALGASVAWALAVWWFGEGLGGIFTGAGSPIGGGPGAVLFYALLAVLLWPADRAGAVTPRFVAARFVGMGPAQAVWVVVWLGLAGLVLGSGRAPQGVHDLIAGSEAGQPGWLRAIDRHAASAVAHHGLVVSVLFACVCVVVALGVALPAPGFKAVLVLALVTSVAVWVIGQNFGMILPGSATDPNSGPLLALLALAYWPISARDGQELDAAGQPDRVMITAGAH